MSATPAAPGSQSGSRRPGWHRLSAAQRRAALAEWLGRPLAELEPALLDGGLDVAAAERMVEAVLGRYALPFALAPNFCIDGRDRLLPMVVEEASVVAAATLGARCLRAGGGFVSESTEPIMVAQVHLAVSDPLAAHARLEAAEAALLERSRAALPRLVARGGGPRGVELRDLGPLGEGRFLLTVHLLVDVRDAMGANLLNGLAEALAPQLEDLSGGQALLSILSNACEERRVRLRAEVPLGALATDPAQDRALREGVALASRVAELDPRRAVTHNKGIFNGLDAVVLATGNDWRAVEAAGHAWSARSGSVQPLCRWWLGAAAELCGELELPLALGIVGGATRVHPLARLALAALGVTSAQELAVAAAAAGMACNLSALRALAGEGIQRGHMRLHARSRSLVEGDG